MTSPSRGGRKVKATDNKADYFNRGHVYIPPPPSRRGSKAEATDNRLKFFDRSHVYMTSPSRGGSKTEVTDNILDYFNRAHVYMTSPSPPQEEAGRLKLQTDDKIISTAHIFIWPPPLEEAVKLKLLIIGEIFQQRTCLYDLPLKRRPETEATHNRLDYFDRAQVYMTSPPEKAGRLKVLTIDWIISAHHMLVWPPPPEEAGRLKLLAIDWIIST